MSTRKSRPRVKERASTTRAISATTRARHDLIDPPYPLNLRSTLADLKIDLAIDRMTDADVHDMAELVAQRVYGSDDGVSGAAAERRVVLAAYFLGVHCGRMTQPTPPGGAR